MKILTHAQVFDNKFITIEDIQSKAPSCFTSVVSQKASDKYVFIYTPDVIKNLLLIGWVPIDAYQVNPKKEENKGFQKHFIKFRNPKYFIGCKNNIEIIPELLLVNSYDAKCSFKFYITLYRIVSDSAIVMKSDELLDEDGREKMTLPHKGDKSSDYHELSNSFDQNISTVVRLMNDLTKIELDDKQQKEFAKECCRARWDYTYQLLNTKSLLDPWREVDEKNDLLTISYRLQEKLIKGGWTGAGGRAIKPIKDVNRELIINKKLFQIIENYYLQSIKKS